MLPSVRSIILKNCKLLQNDSETGTVFSQPPLISFKRDKNLGNFLVTDHFTSTSANVIYFITCTYCNKLYIGETGKRLGDRFREHLRDVERNDKDASKPVARHFNLPNHSKQHMAVCGLSLHLGSSESRKTLEQKFIFQIGTLNPHGINERFSFN